MDFLLWKYGMILTEFDVIDTSCITEILLFNVVFFWRAS